MSTMKTFSACQRAAQLYGRSLKRSRCLSTAPRPVSPPRATTTTRIPPHPSSTAQPRRVVTVSNNNLNEFHRLMDLQQKEHRVPLSSVSSAAEAVASDSSSNENSNGSLSQKSPSVSTTSSLEEDDSDLLLENLPVDFDARRLQELASRRPTPLRLADMYLYGTSTDLGQRLRNAQFLYDELQIRIAQRAVDLLTLPHGLSEVRPIRKVAANYLEYLQKFANLPRPTNTQQEDDFTDMLQGLVLDRTSVPMDISRGVAAWRDMRHAKDLQVERLQEMEDALYRFFTARVGLRFLTEHHVLSSPRPSAQELRKVTHVFPDDDIDDKDGQKKLGCIHANCDLVKEVSRVAKLVEGQTREYYDVCPKIEILDCIAPTVASRDFTYVPHHLHYMLGELLKNSCRATVRHSLGQSWNNMTGNNTAELPAIRVIIVKGEEDVTIKIADKGGGIPRSLMDKIWKFAHSTADEEESQTEFGKDEFSGARTIRGFGLPLSRIYARYFGGELTLKSTEGYGLDAYLHLPRLGTTGESLPLRVRASPGERDSTTKQVRHFTTARSSSS